ncbi:uncharacterized protein LOC117229726 isoform X1 [Megalopta genalis]|uniref:uncharacterized protein LOC117229726 isoform X1 n=1 Tax=Megalopta genalis TaxID=115081 RepID=UPI003FD1AA7A
MFIYIVAIIFTPLIIFGLVHTRCLANWIRWKVINSLSTCNRLTRRPLIETLTINESTENLCTPERSFDIIEEIDNTESLSTAPLQRSLFDNKEGSSDTLLTPRYSFEDVLPEAREKHFESSETRTRKENLFESLKNTIEKSTNPSNRLNTTQIYNLILKETLKENLARQKLLETERRKINNEATSLKITEQAASSSENMSEQDGESRESLQSADIHHLNNAM